MTGNKKGADALKPKGSQEISDHTLGNRTTGRADLQHLDKASQAAVDWLINRDPDAFDHLVAICWKAKKNLYIAGESGMLLEATQEWIQDFVLDFLAPYLNATPQAVRQAAEEGKFRYIGRRCYLKMIDEIRTRTAKKNQPPTIVSLDTPVVVDDAGGEHPLGDFLSIPSNNPYGGPERPQCALGHRTVYVGHLIATEEDYREELGNLVGGRGLAVLDALFWAYTEDDANERLDDPVGVVAACRGVGIRQAQKDTAALRKRMSMALKSQNPAAQAIYAILIDANRVVIVPALRKRVRFGGSVAKNNKKGRKNEAMPH